MKVLSVVQPWASLIVHGMKRLETRSWATRHRGPLAIHASKSFPPAARMLCHQQPYRTLLAAAGFAEWTDLPTGTIIGLAEIAGCTRALELGDLPELERQLGDFAPNRWAWSVVNPQPLPVPMPWRGRLGIVDLPDGLIDETASKLPKSSETSEVSGRQ